MAKKKTIMSWSKCKIEIAKLTTDYADTGAPTDPSDFMSVGIINDKSTSLNEEDGETLTAKATGGVVVAQEHGENTVTLTYRVKEPSFEFEQSILGAELNAAKDELLVKSTVVDGDYAVRVTPKNVGAIGIVGYLTDMSYKIGSSEEEGHYVDITHTFMTTESGYLYKKFRVKAPVSNT